MGLHGLLRGSITLRLMDLYTHLLIYRLFNDAVGNSKYTVSEGGMINEQ
jgi:hypothetical protein